MRKLIISAFIMIFILLFTFFNYEIVKKTRARESFEERIASLPAFSFMTLTDVPFSSESIEEGPVLIVRFDPGCEHCQYELSAIAKSNIPDSETKLILVTSADKNSVVKFLEPLDFLGSRNVIPLLDTAGRFGRLFGADYVPSNYIYDKELKLVKVLQGEYKIETILKYLQEGE